MGHSVEDIEIPVPWGHIAAKSLGDSSGIPILMIHGIQDNSGSFDRLLMHLPGGFYYFCIDLPSHGKSSSFPPGQPLEFFHFVYAVKLVIEHLQWKQFIFVCHSLGAQIAVIFSSIYPELVEKIVLIDGLSPLVMSEEQSISHVRKIFESIFHLQKKLSLKSPPSYSYDEALARLMNNRPTDLTKEAAETLIKRSIVPSGNGYRFSTDQRLKFTLRPILTMKQMKHFVMNIKCPVMMILAKDTYKLITTNSYDELFHERLRTLFLSMPNVTAIVIEGNHDVHLNYPERVAPHINAFLFSPKKSSL